MVALMAITFNGFSQVNHALTAVATHSGGGSLAYGPTAYNDGIIPAYGSAPWGWVSSNGSIEYTWTSPVSINTIVLFKDNRPMTTCDIQYWDGSQYVTFLNYNNPTSAIKDSITFPTVVTTKLKFNNVGGSANPNHREIQALFVQNGINDAAVLGLDSPAVFCPGTESIYARIANLGINKIDSVIVNWSINGTLQTPINLIATLDTINGAGSFDTSLFIANRNFIAGVLDTIKVWTSLPNGMADTVNTNDTISKILSPAISGNYTVNASLPASASNYTSIATLNQGFSFGICGAVNVTIAAGTYNESLILNGVTGVSATNTIIIDGGDSSTTILSQDGTLNYATVIINETDYVTVKNLGIFSTAIVPNAAVAVAKSDYVSILNCDINVDITSTLSTINAVIVSGNVISNSSGAEADYFTLSNNKINGGYWGLSANAAVTKALSNITVTNNVFRNQWYYGAYLYYTDSADFSGNDIDITTRNNTFAAASYLYYSSNFNVSENKLLGNSYGIYIYNFTTPFTKTRKGRIVNNFMSSASNITLYMYYVDSVDIFHNTVVAHSANPAAQMYSSTSALVSDYDVRNNIFYSASSFALRTNIPDTIYSNLDYNLYYTGGSSLFSINSVTYTDLTAYTTAQALLNTNSIEGDPQFLNSPFDFHLIGTTANDVGDNTVGVLTDIDGDSRPLAGSTIVDIGADEFNPPTCPPPTAISFTNITLNSADINITGGATSSWRFEYDTLGFTPGNGNFVLTTSNVATISGLNTGTAYQVYIREICSSTDSSPQIGPYSFGTAFSVPFDEDFESFASGEIGPIYTNNWTNSGTTVPRWESEVSTGSNVNSSATGPLYDATFPATAGGNYIYLETSGGALGDQNTLSMPSLFIPATSNALNLKFSYHMHGATMGNLYVVVDTNNVTDTLVTLIGQQQVTQTDPWLEASAALAGYGGKSITVRFIGVRGSSFTGDISIDEVHIFEPANQEIGVTDLTAPKTQCGLTAAEAVTIEITNFGLMAATNFPATFTVDGTTSVTETISASILPGSSLLYTFTGTANLATQGLIR